MYGGDAGLQACPAADALPSGFIGLADEVLGACGINPKQGLTDNSDF